MMEVERRENQVNAPEILTTLLTEFSAVTDYRTLRDNLPRRLASLLGCRCVLLYQRIGETLQFISGSFDDNPGWSSGLLSVAHINPISLSSDVPEVMAWRQRHAVPAPRPQPNLIAVPLIYRHRVIGVISVIHLPAENSAPTWQQNDISLLEAIAGVVALLLENTRLLERDRERIHELSLLNSIGSQLNCSLYELSRLRSVVVQRAREIANADRCDLLETGPETIIVPWIGPQLQDMLFRRFQEQVSPAPFILERPGDAANPYWNTYLQLLPETVKTFFAFPLVSGRSMERRGGSLLRGSLAPQDGGLHSKMLGIIVGAYHQPRKLQRAEEVLLRVLASQASTVLENIHLVGEVIEARNEARKLLRKVLDDQRLKELILASIPSGLVTTDRQGFITTFNRAAEAILGYHPFEVVGQPLHKFLDLRGETSAALAVHDPDALQDEVVRESVKLADLHGGTVTTVDRQGQDIVLDIAVLPLQDDMGSTMGVLITFTDVTSVHRLEEEKRRLDRLASLGEMAANVAHEVRNPLASIKTSMQILKDDLSYDDTTVPSAEQITWAKESVAVTLKEVERLDAIVRDLLLFAKPRQLHRSATNLVELCDRVLNLLQTQCAEANIVVHRVYADLPLLLVDIGQMEQVLWNIVVNAIQAMPDGGILTVTCRCLSNEQVSATTDDAPDFSLEPAYKSAMVLYHVQRNTPVEQWLEVAISDTGMGIPADQLERIFQPFFTTKAHGIGLGLAITRRLIEDHGGAIHIDGQYGYGTTVLVRLPVVDKEKNLDLIENSEVGGESGA